MQDPDAILNRMVLAAGRSDALLELLHRQARESQSAIEATREAQEARFQHTLARALEQHQAQIDAALQPKVAWAWKVLITTTVGIALLLGAGAMLLRHSHQRLQAAEARAAAAEVDAEVMQALGRVRITSCGGQPCVLMDRNLPTWKAAQGEFVLLGDNPAP